MSAYVIADNVCRVIETGGSDGIPKNNRKTMLIEGREGISLRLLVFGYLVKWQVLGRKD